MQADRTLHVLARPAVRVFTARPVATTCAAAESQSLCCPANEAAQSLPPLCQIISKATSADICSGGVRSHQHVCHRAAKCPVLPSLVPKRSALAAFVVRDLVRFPSVGNPLYWRTGGSYPGDRMACLVLEGVEGRLTVGSIRLHNPARLADDGHGVRCLPRVRRLHCSYHVHGCPSRQRFSVMWCPFRKYCHWVLFSLLLSGCASRSLPAPPRIVVQPDQAEAWYGHPLSAHLPEGPYWLPSPPLIQEAERALAREVSARKALEYPEDLQPLSIYGIQYLGVKHDGRPLIYANGFCDWEPLGVNPDSAWVTVYDGGPCYFQARYSPEAKQIEWLSFNGVASSPHNPSSLADAPQAPLVSAARPVYRSLLKAATGARQNLVVMHPSRWS